MTYDAEFLFSSNIDLLSDVCTFMSSLNNRIISQNEEFLIRHEMESDPFVAFNEQLKEELNIYKCYDV